MRILRHRHSVQALRPRGFTLIEIMLVVVILSIAAMLAIPFAASGAASQLKAAATILAADLEYAKSMAISRGQDYWVEFNTSTNSYSIKDASDTVITNPLTGKQYIINFSSDNRFSRVDITSVNFDATGSTVGFDYLGSPQHTGGDLNGAGEITLSAGGSTLTVRIEPVTGYITIY
ncbi:MAG: GspH/FimT family pseudopilin [Phycisphaerae bacterium]